MENLKDLKSWLWTLNLRGSSSFSPQEIRDRILKKIEELEQKQITFKDAIEYYQDKGLETVTITLGAVDDEFVGTFKRIRKWKQQNQFKTVKKFINAGELYKDGKLYLLTNDGYRNIENVEAWSFCDVLDWFREGKLKKKTDWAEINYGDDYGDNRLTKCSGGVAGSEDSIDNEWEEDVPDGEEV